MNRIFTLLLLSLHLSTLLSAQSNLTDAPVPKRKYVTQRAPLNSIKLDGAADEAAWQIVDWSSDFVEYKPDENTAPAYPTRFKVLYDSKFLYLAYHCLDARDSIVKRMGRRDEFPGDWVEVNLDCYHDLRTAFSFTLSASGVRGDEFISGNGENWDGNWNPIWHAKTLVNDSGWTAEIKIPLSQLRYNKDPDKVWGLQVQRLIFRKEERSYWQYIPQRLNGWVSNFGELHGLNNVKPQKQVELAPYVVAQTTTYKKQEGNPFATGKDSRISGGIDGKVAVTGDLILDFTVNPDFGQVEADPSQVRLDGFENFFEERRPFFIESRNIFDYQLTGSVAGGDYDADLLFYSRRIGSSPHTYPQLSKGEYAKVPDKTTILGAAKFSGKTKNGWSIGLLESVTQREKALIDNKGDRRKELVEPLANYFVARTQKDIDGGNTVIGAVMTAVNREKGLDDLLHSSAFSGGIDFQHYWNKRSWYYAGNLVMSQVQGSRQAIFNTQTSIEHLFQRPDITEAKLDSNRTSLTGTGGTFKIGKAGGTAGKYGQIIKFQTGVTWRSPQLELNDIGFMLSANEINHFTWAAVQFQQPFSVFRNASVNYNHWARWDFSGKLLYVAFNTNAHGLFRNFWNLGMGFDYNPYDVSNVALRGSTALRKPQGIGGWLELTTDTRKKAYSTINISKGFGPDRTLTWDNYSISINAQPVNAFRAGLSLGFSDFWRRQDQYVATADYNGSPRIIVGELHQQTIRVTLRMTYNLTPDLTIQYYGQPYITRPVYGNFAYVKDPLNPEYDNRFHQFNASQITSQDGQYSIDENTDGITDYSFYKPDFNFVQFRSNLVMRWEYKAGSEFYLVWSQGNTPQVASDIYSPIANSLLNHAFSNEASNIFLLKFTYRFLK
jgi:hypothetical protein